MSNINAIGIYIGGETSKSVTKTISEIVNIYSIRVLADGALFTTEMKTKFTDTLISLAQSVSDKNLSTLAAFVCPWSAVKLSGQNVTKVYGLTSAFDYIATGTPIYCTWNSVLGNYFLNYASNIGNYISSNKSSTGIFSSNFSIDFKFKIIDENASFICNAVAAGDNNCSFSLSYASGFIYFAINNGSGFESKNLAAASIGQTKTGTISYNISTKLLTYNIDGVNGSVQFSYSINNNATSNIQIGVNNRSYKFQTFYARMYNSNGNVFSFNANDFNYKNNVSQNQFQSVLTGEIYTINYDSIANGYKCLIVDCPYILFNSSTDYLRATYNLNQPHTDYFCARDYATAINKTLFDGNVLNQGRVYSSTSGGAISANAGSILGSISPVYKLFHIAQIKFNGSDSSIRRNKTIPIIGNAGNSTITGNTIASSGDNTYFSNLQLSTFAQFSAAHDLILENKVIDTINAKCTNVMISGLIEDIPLWVSSINITEDGITYGGGATKAWNISQTIQAGWSSAMVDAWFIAYALTAPTVTAKTLNLGGTNQAPTAASAAARTTITGKGFLIIIN